MKRSDRELDELIEQVTVDAYGDEGFTAFAQSFEESIDFPVEATLAGMPVQLLETDFDGNDPRGLIAVIRRAGNNYRVSVLDLEFDANHPAATLAAAYLRWSGNE